MSPDVSWLTLLRSRVARASHTQSTAAADLAASTALHSVGLLNVPTVRLWGPRGTRLRVTRLVSTAISTPSPRSGVRNAGHEGGVALIHRLGRIRGWKVSLQRSYCRIPDFTGAGSALLRNFREGIGAKGKAGREDLGCSPDIGGLNRKLQGEVASVGCVGCCYSQRGQDIFGQFEVDG